MHRLTRLLEATDPELAAHGRRTARLAHDVALQMDLPTERAERIRVAALLHDIGKLFLPREILDKPGPLTEEQWVELRHHPRMGYELISGRVPSRVAEVVLAHHEWFDGSGYPNAISGAHIPLEARVLQVADAFDAITSTRPYQEALPVDFAVSEMVRCSGTQFDPTAVEGIVSLTTSSEWRSAHVDSSSDLRDEVAV